MPSVDLTPPLICSHLTIPPLPTLPAGFSLSMQVPGFGFLFDLTLCCKIFQLPVGLLPPIDLGFAVQLPLIVALNEFITTINTFLNQVPVFCPREPINEAFTHL